MAANYNSSLTLIAIFSLFLATTAAGRFITTTSPSISDGVNNDDRSILRLNPLFTSSPEECEQTYGFMPCTTTAAGNLFLIIVYGYLMFLAATYLSAGSELLLAILGPGLVGGLCLPALGALPDAMLILVYDANCRCIRVYLHRLVFLSISFFLETFYILFV